MNTKFQSRYTTFEKEEWFYVAWNHFRGGMIFTEKFATNEDRKIFIELHFKNFKPVTSFTED